jgi:hypothetical protein
MFYFILCFCVAYEIFAVYIFRGITPTYNTIKGGTLLTPQGDTIPWSPKFQCNFGGDIPLLFLALSVLFCFFL